MKYGVLLNTQAAPDRLPAQWRHNFQVAQVLEESGFTSVHVPEHHMQADGFLSQPLVACAALAARTETLRVGTTILVAPLRDPIHLAEEAATVDVLSDGRLILGLGIGNYDPELQLFGIPRRTQAGRFDDALTVLTTAWRDDVLTMKGTQRDYTDVLVSPRPVQQPHPELWVGAMSKAGCDRAARFGATLVLDPLHPVAAFAPYVAHYRERAAQYGTTPRVALLRWACLADDPDFVSDQWWPGVRGMFWHYLKEIPRVQSDMDSRLLAMTRPEELTVDTVQNDRLLIGTAQEIRSQVAAWEKAIGVNHLVVRVEPPTGPSTDEVIEMLRKFGRDVIGAA